VAYPVGVAVPILLLALYNAWRKPQSAPGIAPTLHMEEVDVTEFNVLGMTLAEAARRLPAGIAIAAIRRGHHNLVPAGTMALARGDVLLVTGAARTCCMTWRPGSGPYIRAPWCTTAATSITNGFSSPARRWPGSGWRRWSWRWRPG
jgi:hypothetical protein